MEPVGLEVVCARGKSHALTARHQQEERWSDRPDDARADVGDGHRPGLAAPKGPPRVDDHRGREKHTVACTAPRCNFSAVLPHVHPLMETSTAPRTALTPVAPGTRVRAGGHGLRSLTQRESSVTLRESKAWRCSSCGGGTRRRRRAPRARSRCPR
ncbi:mobile element transfer protein [Streptomyces sp. NPDC102274]|uniref:mobile element transfer protein n=1 Tax=Streptomyces sp. NPDC102274 TaxID=3366151 RepID=UPI0037F673BB